MNIKWLAFLLLSIYFLPVKAEEGSEAKKSYFTAGANYSTDAVWEGRSDSIVTPYIGTSLMYHFGFGAYVGGTLNFFPNRKENVLDQSVVQAGYDFPVIKDKLSGSLSYSAYFYSKYSTQVKSEIKGVASAGLSYDASIFQWSVNASYDIGHKSDLTLSSSLSKGFEFLRKGDNVFSLTPTASAYAGTQNLYALYLINRPGKILQHGKKAGTTVGASSSMVETSAYSQLNLLDIDLSLPLSYTLDKFTFGITPTYAIPMHVQTGEFTNRHFYTSFSVEMKF